MSHDQRDSQFIVKLGRDGWNIQITFTSSAYDQTFDVSLGDYRSDYQKAQPVKHKTSRWSSDGVKHTAALVTRQTPESIVQMSLF